MKHADVHPCAAYDTDSVEHRNSLTLQTRTYERKMEESNSGQKRLGAGGERTFRARLRFLSFCLRANYMSLSIIFPNPSPHSSLTAELALSVSPQQPRPGSQQLVLRPGLVSRSPPSPRKSRRDRVNEANKA